MYGEIKFTMAENGEETEINCDVNLRNANITGKIKLFYSFIDAINMNETDVLFALTMKEYVEKYQESIAIDTGEIKKMFNKD